MEIKKSGVKEYEIVLEDGSKVVLTETEIVEIVARRILNQNKDAFNRLAQ